VTAHRFLFVVPPLAGHVNPTIAVGSELAARGHEVAWTGFPEVVTDLLGPDRTFLPVAASIAPELVDTISTRASGLRGAAALKFLWEDFMVPLAEAMVPGVDRAVTAFGPDVLVVDQQTLAGGVVAERDGRVWATSATTSAELVDPFQGLPKVREWLDQLLIDLQVAHGVPGPHLVAERIRSSRHLVLAFTTQALVGPDLYTTAPVAFVGPAVGGRPDDTPFPWERLGEADRWVLVSLGTVNADQGGAFFAAVTDALAARGVGAIVVARPEVAPADAPGRIVASRVPQLALLDRVDAVVTHGGHNTVCESLAHSLPLVVAPSRDDQPVIAEQVVAAGAGVRVRFARPTADGLGAALDRVLSDPDLRAAAGRIAVSFAHAGGAPAAADHLESLAVRTASSQPVSS
jgi:MGT family glycosyltransferase